MHGSPQEDRETGETRQLTPAILAEAGLARNNQQSRTSVIGYTHTPDNKIVARNYYESLSQTAKRLHQGKTPTEGIAKGYGENSLAPPFEVQAALSEIMQHDKVPVEEALLAYYGTATGYDRLSNTYVAEVAPQAEKLAGIFITKE